MRDLIIQNRFLKYRLQIDDNGCLRHHSFLPFGDERITANTSTKEIYPYEVVCSTDFDDELGCHIGGRNVYFATSDELIFQNERHNGPHYEIILLNRRKQLEITLCYDLFEHSPVLRRYSKVKNLGENPIVLNHISSFVLCNFPYFGQPHNMRLHAYSSGWCYEADEHDYSFPELGLYGASCRNAYSFDNLSAYSTVKYFPYYVIEEPDSDLAFGIQMESMAQWRIEVGGGDEHNSFWYYAQGGPPSFNNGGWSKTLNPGETYKTFKTDLTVSSGGVQAVYRNFHRFQHNELIHRAEFDSKMPVIYNDWQCMGGDTSEKRICEQLPILKEIGVEIYVTDAGWYVPPGKDWCEYVGCWREDPARFPNGLSAAAEKIREAGLLPGIWCEIEMAGVHSPFYDDPEKVLTLRGKPITRFKRRFLDFENRAVRDYAAEVVKYLYDSGFRYLKIDYNADCMPGCDGNDENIVENLAAKRRAYASWVTEILARYTDLMIEHCASGGLKLDYDNLSRASLASITDQYNYLYTAGVFYNVVRLIHPSQCGNWSKAERKLDAETTAYILTNSMMGRMCISGVFSEAEPQVVTTAKRAVAFYRKYREIIENAQTYFHTPPLKLSDSGMKCMEFISGDGESSLLYFGANGSEETCRIQPHLNGFGVTDAFPSTDGIEIGKTDICAAANKGVPFCRILVLKKC